MNRLKTLKDRVRRLLALLSLGVLFFSSCSLADMIEFRDADSGPAPYHAAETETPKEPADLVHETIPIENETDAQPDANPDPETDVDANAAAWIARYESLFGEGAADEILLTSEEIAAYNRRIIEECPTVVDIAAVPESMEGKNVQGMLLIDLPAVELFNDDGEHFSWDPVRANASTETVPDTVVPQRAVVTARCDMKSLPTSSGLFEGKDRYYSKIQLTELIVGMPVWVLHESADGAFLFVQSYYYIGWIPSNAVALCDAEDYERFAKPEDPVVVLRHAVPCGETALDMGVALPFRAETETGWTVSLPTRDEDGRLALADFELKKDEAVHGYLPYTMRNTYTQAFACLGIPYGWGGTDGGLDCSGFVCAVFRTFGIYLPRDTRDQKDHAGIAHTGMTEEETERLLKESRFPVCLYSPGHVMLYLGEVDGTPTVIHAPQGGETVTLAPLEQERTLISLVEMK
ncbi:MAG: SH3 domain-containing protein [Clostridiales bacterium]|nr:SH3 domain-containing protein [Clostridiales bacterium]